MPEPTHPVLSIPHDELCRQRQAAMNIAELMLQVANDAVLTTKHDEVDYEDT